MKLVDRTRAAGRKPQPRLGGELDFFLSRGCGSGSAGSSSGRGAIRRSFAAGSEVPYKGATTGSAADKSSVALAFATHGSTGGARCNHVGLAMNLDALQPQPEFGRSGKPAGSLRATHYELGVRAFGDHHSAVGGHVLRDSGDNTFPGLRVFRAEGLIDGNRDGGARGNRSRCIRPSSQA